MKYLSELEKQEKNWGNGFLQQAIWKLPNAVANSGGWEGWLVKPQKKF